MEDHLPRVNAALSAQEATAEKIANHARLGFLAMAALMALMNAPAVTIQSNLINFGALAIALAYTGTISVLLRRSRYRRAMKYATSLLDISLIHLALIAYTGEESPTVALKNPLFLMVYPVIGMTVFRYDPRLTLATGGFALLIYGGLFMWVSRHVAVPWGDYAAELSGPGITTVSQLTKIMALIAFIGAMALLARYTRSLFHRLVRTEVDSRLEREKIERELELAAQVQSHLLPRTCPGFDRLSLYATVVEGRPVGGDYHDLIPLSDQSVLLVIADVAGKGVPAALIMSELRAATHLCASLRLGIEEALHRMNRLLHDSTAPQHYVTAFLAEIDLREDRMRYVNAGHPPPLFLSGNTVSRLSEGTHPLGLFASLQELRIQSVDLLPGSVLVACTDGVSERANELGEEFGETELQRFLLENRSLDSGAFAQRLLAEVKHFGGDRPFEDDATLIVARCGGEGAGLARLGL